MHRGDLGPVREQLRALDRDDVLLALEQRRHLVDASQPGLETLESRVDDLSHQLIHLSARAGGVSKWCEAGRVVRAGRLEAADSAAREGGAPAACRRAALWRRT